MKHFVAGTLAVLRWRGGYLGISYWYVGHSLHSFTYLDVFQQSLWQVEKTII